MMFDMPARPAAKYPIPEAFEEVAFLELAPCDRANQTCMEVTDLEALGMPGKNRQWYL